MSIDTTTWLAWGFPLNSKNSEFTDPLIEILPMGCQMSNDPEYLEFAAVKSSMIKISDNDGMIAFNSMSIAHLPDISLDDRVALIGFINKNNLHSTGIAGWYILNWLS